MSNIQPGKATGEAFDVGGINVRWVSPGKFVMGSPKGIPNLEAYEARYEVQHNVILTRGFWISDHQVTQGEYCAVMGCNPSEFRGSRSLPVESMSWDDAVKFCQNLTQKHRIEGVISEDWEWRLPTEAEWEYAARAGTTGTRYGNLDEIGWYSKNSGGRTHPVKKKTPNAWGLYDMIGNVEEWCQDCLGEYSAKAATDPKGPMYIPGKFHVFRGGSWDSAAEQCRSASRFRLSPGDGKSYLGFRSVLSSVH